MSGGRGLANRKMRKAAKLQKKLLAVERRRGRHGACASSEVKSGSIDPSKLFFDDPKGDS